jgi:hypothetical protein
MSRYRKVDPRIWNDAKFRALNNHGKLLFFMLLTHPGMTALGAMRATPSGLAEELGWEVEAFRKAFGDVLSKGMAEHDAKACLIALPKFIRYNQPESPNVIKAWVGALDLLPECDLKTEIVQRAKAIVGEMTEGFGKAFAEAFGQAMPYQEPKQEPKQKQKKHPPTPSRGSVVSAPGFERFWNAWPKHPRKAAPAQCRKKWVTHDCEAIADKIVAHVEAMKASEQWRKDGSEYIPAPLVYLNQQRWIAPLDATEAQPWHDTRSGIDAKAAELGINPWDQAAWERGEREAWPQYEARVFAAAGHSPRAAAC